jgi:hypothetical protein
MHRRSLFLYWTLFHYMFRPNCAIFRCTGVVGKDSAATCNAVFFPPIVVTSGSFGYVGCAWLLLVLFGLLVVCWSAIIVRSI